ncbi:MAG: NADH dehydrogenase [Lachnospiraceae bacterium]|nr:NADH dehydrogenase [Lachnospiraceae bacterium]
MNENMILAVLVFYPFLGAFLTAAAGAKKESIRNYVADFIVVSEFILTLILFVANAGKNSAETLYSCYLPEICGMGLHFTMDGFRLVYSTVAAFMWMMTMLLSGEYCKHHENTNRFYLFMLATLGATMGVFLSSDLFTTFIFFEIMSFTSYVWVAQEETENALRAAATYLAVAVIGGLVMLMGIFILYHELGTLEMDMLFAAAKTYENKAVLYGAGACLLVGFGAKAGAFPLHIWLPKAHPIAPAPASALLSGILTKTGIFGILIVSCKMFYCDAAWGSLILGIGVLTMFGGAFLAVFSVDLKRTLACSSMSQIGFILVGIGMQGLLGEENMLAVHGTFLHMVNHSMIKLVLFMAAGVVFMNTHALDLNEIRGFGRKKPLLKVIFLVGALAIGGIPLFSGYISKTLLHESIVEYGGGALIKTVEVIFLISGGLTLAYMTKLFMAVFVESNQDAEKQKKYDDNKQYMNKVSGFALTVSAIVLFLWGLIPHLTMDKAAELGESFMNFLSVENAGHRVAYFSLGNLKGALISIIIGVIVYVFIIRKLLIKNGAYINAWPKWLDVENLLYRPILLVFLPTVCGIACRVCDSAVDMIVVFLRKTSYKDSPLPYERREGNAFTAFTGRVLNFWQALRNRLWGRKHPTHTDFVHLTAAGVEDFRESFMIIQRSLSFGLLMFGIGLALTLIYIILW